MKKEEKKSDQVTGKLGTMTGDVPKVQKPDLNAEKKTLPELKAIR